LTFKEKKQSPVKVILIILIVLLGGGSGYLYLSPVFEQNKPVIEAPLNIYWNLKSKLTINLEDESGIKYYKVTFKDGQRDIILNKKVFNTIQKNITVDINPPKLDMFYKGKNCSIEIEAVDNSKWNLLEGNKVIKTIDIKIDTKKPTAKVIANSRYIQRGGSAVVVVKVEDENLKDAFISFNSKLTFKLTPYYKPNYYAALIAWPIDIKEFKGVMLVAYDKAGNKTYAKVPLYIQGKKFKIDNIKLDKKFISNISRSVLEQSGEAIPDKLEDIFIYSNSVLRDKNIKTIKKVAMDAMDNDIISDWKIKAFKRLRGSKTVASYGQRRHYYLDGKKINEAWHLGMDWASVRKAPIRTTNSGKVIFNDYLGLYGNAIIIDHGLGLATLYAHTSSQDVEVGEMVNNNQKIANTGATGAVFGDHLHFGVLVQGIEVNPIEWMDRNWIKVRIDNILKKAKKDINRATNKK
jgi:murein DD-endopeptidase MepM/ murein hydrolase activator NlpD